MDPSDVTSNTAIRYYVHIDEMYDELDRLHKKIGHGGRDKMAREAHQLFKNVSRTVIRDFIVGCENCELKRSNKKKGLVVKPIVHITFNSRAQLDLVDMQTHKDGDYSFIFVHQNHLTKFVTLKPLRTKTAVEVARVLLTDVFTVCGAPVILQSDNGREFVNSVTQGVQAMWPDLRIIYGKLRHSQSQGSVERCNQDVESMIFTRTADNKAVH